MFDGLRPRVYGRDVILSKPYRLVPRLKHRKRANGGKASYHQRIQKKWLKRFGTKAVETQPKGQVYVMGDTLVIREDDWPDLMRALNG